MATQAGEVGYRARCLSSEAQAWCQLLWELPRWQISLLFLASHSAHKLRKGMRGGWDASQSLGRNKSLDSWNAGWEFENSGFTADERDCLVLNTLKMATTNYALCYTSTWVTTDGSICAESDIGFKNQHSQKTSHSTRQTHVLYKYL